MERKTTSIPPVERVGRIAPVLPVRFFKPFPDQSELRRRKQPQQAKQQSGKLDSANSTIDLKI